MNVSISFKLRSKDAGIVSRLKVEKKGITKVLADSIVKEVQKVVPTPDVATKGTDRGQIVIKVDGKVVFNEKFKGIVASKINIFTPAVVTPENKTSSAVVKKPVVKKSVAVKK